MSCTLLLEGNGWSDTYTVMMERLIASKTRMHMMCGFEDVVIISWFSFVAH